MISAGIEEAVSPYQDIDKYKPRPFNRIMNAQSLLCCGMSVVCLQAGELVDPVRPVLENFDQEIDRLDGVMEKYYGPESLKSGWRASFFPEQLAEELDWVRDEARSAASRLSDLEEREGKLISRRFSLKQDLDSLDRQEKARQEKLRLNGEREAAWKIKHAEYNAAALKFNARPKPTDPAGIAAYNAEVAEGHAWLARLQVEERDGLREKALLEGEGKVIARKLEEQNVLVRPFLERDWKRLSRDVTALMFDCRQGTDRARALAEVEDSPATERQRATKQPKTRIDSLDVTAYAADIGAAAVAQLALPHAALAAQTMRCGALVVDVRDIMSGPIERQGEETDRHLLLLGDYAAAMHHLKANGRLNPEDPGYQALRAALRSVSTGMPKSEEEFMHQAGNQTLAFFQGVFTKAVGKFSAHEIGKYQIGIDMVPAPAVFTKSGRILAEMGNSLIELLAEEVGEKVTEAAIEARPVQRSAAAVEEQLKEAREKLP